MLLALLITHHHHRRGVSNRCLQHILRKALITIKKSDDIKDWQAVKIIRLDCTFLARTLKRELEQEKSVHMLSIFILEKHWLESDI